ncbi:MAG: L,D-transpeptidase family protein [Hyphomicrobiaceae bacterium]
MHAVLRLSAVSVAILTMLAPVQAVEPQAPDRLITAEEAVLIAIRSRLTNVRVSRKPTQTEKGAAIDRAGLAKFYATLGEQGDVGGETGRPLWVTRTGLTDQAQAALREINNSPEWGFSPDHFDMPEHAFAGSEPLSARELVNLEMRTSLAILKYARFARGGRMDPTDLSLDIDRKPPLLPASDVLRGAHEAADVAVFLQGLHPKHDQFVKLRAAYLKALEDEADGIEPVVEEETRRGKKRRKRKRSRTPLSKRLLYNMEMWRWMPEDLGDVYVMPNIPEFRIRVIKKDRIIHSERIVAGKVANKTPVFSDELETVVFRPNWGIPNSIKVKEILPKILSGKGIERQGFRVQAAGRDIDPRTINWSTVDIRNYHIYQPPGRRNALGLVKFLFPNKHAVYFHDTPSKYLFKKKYRAYSHGCMRVRDPMKMAAVIFGEDRGWTQAKIDELAASRVNNRQIRLNKKIPVHVTYFTARANQDGEIELVKDVYGHEKLIQKGFDGLAHTIVKPNRSLDKYLRDRIGRSEIADNRVRRRRSRDWMRNIWGN